MPTCPVKNRTKCNHIKQVTYIAVHQYAHVSCYKSYNIDLISAYLPGNSEFPIVQGQMSLS